MPGAVNYVEAGDLDVAGDQLTVEALMHYTGVSNNIVSKHTGPANVNYLLRIGSFEITTTAGFANFGGVAAAGVNLVQGETYHVAATYNGQFLRYYVNGCMTGEMPWTGDMIQNDLMTAIGQQSACQCEQFTGYIDEVRIWNVARTQQEIADNMLDLPNPATTPGLLAYYKFDGNFNNNQGNPAWNGNPIGAPQLQLIPDPYPHAMNASVSASDPLCNNGGDGVIDVAGSGAYLPYEYSLDGVNFAPNNSFQNLPAGNYTVFSRPQNNNQCVVTNNITINNPLPIVSNLTTTDVSCFGGADGTATIAPTGGNGPDYPHIWTPNTSTNLTIQNLPQGNYSVDISDSCKSYGQELILNGHFENGYMNYTTDYIEGVYASQIPGGEYAVTFDPLLYHNGFVGTGAGGAGNFMIVNSSATPNQNVWCQSIAVNPNTYYNFSLLISSMFAVSPAELEIIINGVPLPTTAVAPANTNMWNSYEESWFSGASTQADICIVNTNIASNGNDFGLDNISFKECASCTETFPFTINEPTLLVFNTITVPESCAGANDGEIEVTANGGTPNYTYSIDNGVTFQANNVFTNLAAGNYNVVVRDLNNCDSSQVVTVSAIPSLNFDVDLVNPLCHDGTTGSITVQNVADGTAPYNYSIDNGNTFQPGTFFDNQGSGFYDVVVSDQNGCQTTEQVELINPTELTTGFNLSPVSCSGDSDGQIIFTNTQGGTGNYVYSSDNGATFQPNNVFQNLNAGSYAVVVQDGNGCEFTDNVVVDSPDPLSFDFSFDNLLCFEDNSGVIEYLNVLGGTPNYEFSIDGGITFLSNATFSNLSAGSYDLVLQDDNGCTTSDFVALTEPDPISIDPIEIDASCFGACDGELQAYISGGTSPYNYFWSGNGLDATTEGVTELCSGDYNLFVQDDNGCNLSESMFIYQPVEIVADFFTEESEFTILDPEVDFINTSTGADSYSWNFNDGSQISNLINPTHVFPVEANNYVVELVALNQFGCSDTIRGGIKINDELLFYVPNTFTPDTDGRNEMFIPVFTSGYEPNDYNFMIFNRWGELVFRSTTPNSGWDGNYQGQPAVEGTYVWQIDFRETMTEKRHVYTGHINLLR
jgi:gliding motility-associated-like protein